LYSQLYHGRIKASSSQEAGERALTGRPGVYCFEMGTKEEAKKTWTYAYGSELGTPGMLYFFVWEVFCSTENLITASAGQARDQWIFPEENVTLLNLHIHHHQKSVNNCAQYKRNDCRYSINVRIIVQKQNGYKKFQKIFSSTSFFNSHNSFIIHHYSITFMKITTVLVTGAAGRISYSLIPILLSGSIFGSDVFIRLHLFDIKGMYN
jgi:hypothetical protein